MAGAPVVSALRVYPVKSMSGIDVESARVEPWGLEHDRRWMVVDDAGETITAREQRILLQVDAIPDASGAVTLVGPRQPPLRVEPPTAGRHVPIGLSRVALATDAGPAAFWWLSRLLGMPARLVWLDDPTRRSVGSTHGGRPGDHMSFADAGPVLVTSTASLRQLEDWMAETAASAGEPPPRPLPMTRFRPNLVVDGIDEPFAEDRWSTLRIGSVHFRFGERCDRCVVPTIDPSTLTSSKEPTRTLARRRQWDHAVFFGVRMVPVATGTVNLGDPAEPDG